MDATYDESIASRHPVEFDVAYPERLGRLSTFFRLLLVIPQLIVVYLLGIALFVLTVLAWFAILFTGRYPKGFFDFCTGVMRWQANVYAYTALLRDEYPPFSWEPGEYPLTLDIPRAVRQSRFRLFIRAFAIIPNYIVFYFLQLAAFFTTVIAWFSIMIGGRYPRGLFKFAVGVLRWSFRMNAYVYLLRDEYPPYSINADAKPGNEVVSAIIGLPLFLLYFAAIFAPAIGLLGADTSTVNVFMQQPDDIAVIRPSGSANGVRITLTRYEDDAFPSGSDATLDPGRRWVAFHVLAEKDGRWPSFFFSALFRLEDCFSVAGYAGITNGYAVDGDASDFAFEVFWRGGRAEADVFFQILEDAAPCELEYFTGRGRIRFRFR